MKQVFSTLIFVLTILSPTLLSAQTPNEVIYLNDGRIFSGQITQLPNQVKLVLPDGHEMEFAPGEVKNIKPAESPKRFGFMNYSSLGIWLGSGEQEKNTIVGYQTTLEYRFYNYFSAGVMSGIEGINELTVPLDMSLRLMLPFDDSEVFLQGIGGYSYPLGKPPATDFYEIMNAYGGWNAGATLGYSVQINPLNSFFMALGFRYNEMDYKRSDWYLTSVDRKVIYNRFFVSMGIAFH